MCALLPRGRRRVDAWPGVLLERAQVEAAGVVAHVACPRQEVALLGRHEQVLMLARDAAKRTRHEAQVLLDEVVAAGAEQCVRWLGVAGLDRQDEAGVEHGFKVLNAQEHEERHKPKARTRDVPCVPKQALPS